MSPPTAEAVVFRLRSPLLLSALALGSLLASGCVSAARVREDLDSGRTQGVYLDRLPFEPQRKGLCGPAALSSLLDHWGRPATQEEIGKEAYDPAIGGSSGFALWRYARRAGLAALQVRPCDAGRLDALLGQGIPVILNLDLVDPGARTCLCFGPRFAEIRNIQHYVLVVGHDRTNGLWVIQDGRRPDRVVTEAWLAPRWETRGRWALLAFPPEMSVTGLSYDDHVLGAERVEELGHPEAAVRHLREAVRLEPERPGALNNLAAHLAREPAGLAEAEGLARRAVTASENDPVRRPYAMDTLGVILGKQGHPGEARRLFEEALKLLPPGSDLAKEIQGHYNEQPHPRN